MELKSEEDKFANGRIGLKKGISFVTLGYREAENLKVLLPKVRKMLDSLGEDYEMIVIDSEKPFDNTREVCTENGVVYLNQASKGFGGAYKTGIRKASYDKFLIMDSDGQHPVKYIRSIYKMYIDGGYDVVIGSRYVEGGSNQESFLSRVMSGILNRTYRLFLGIKANDISTNFRMYDTRQLKVLRLDAVNLDIMQEILFKMMQNNKRLKIGETPINLSSRMYGESKRRLLKFIYDYGKTLARLFVLQIKDIRK